MMKAKGAGNYVSPCTVSFKKQTHFTFCRDDEWLHVFTDRQN